VRVLMVDPGEMDTQMHRDAVPEANPAQLRRPRDVAAALVELLETPPATGTRVCLSLRERGEGRGEGKGASAIDQEVRHE